MASGSLRRKTRSEAWRPPIEAPRGKFYSTAGSVAAMNKKTQNHFGPPSRCPNFGQLTGASEQAYVRE